MKKKLLALLMSLSLMLGLLPGAALAADATTLPAAQNGVITLTENVTLSSQYTVASDVTKIDLAGHSITGTVGKDSAVLLVENAGQTLTITSSTGTGSITATGSAADGGAIHINNGATVTLTNVTVTGYAYGVRLDYSENASGTSKSTLNVNSGATVTATQDATTKASNSGDGIRAYGSSIVNVNGGSIKGAGTALGAGNTVASGIELYYNATLNLNSGTVSSEGPSVFSAAIHLFGGKANIVAGSTVTATGMGVWMTSGEKDAYGTNATLTTAGSISGASGIFMDGNVSKVEITGGSVEGKGGTLSNSSSYDTYSGSAVYVQGNVQAANGIKISDGTITGKLTVESVKEGTAPTQPVITGGTFSTDPTAFLAKGYTATQSTDKTTWTVAAETLEVPYTGYDVAKLHDARLDDAGTQAAAIDDDSLYEADSYKLDTVFATSGVTIIPVQASGLKAHQNSANKMGYWVGVTFPAIKGWTMTQYQRDSETAIDLTGALEADGSLNAYFDLNDNAAESNLRPVKITYTNENNKEVTTTVPYNIDLNGVTKYQVENTTGSPDSSGVVSVTPNADDIKGEIAHQQAENEKNGTSNPIAVKETLDSTATGASVTLAQEAVAALAATGASYEVSVGDTSIKLDENTLNAIDSAPATEAPGDSTGSGDSTPNTDTVISVKANQSTPADISAQTSGKTCVTIEATVLVGGQPVDWGSADGANITLTFKIATGLNASDIVLYHVSKDANGSTNVDTISSPDFDYNSTTGIVTVTVSHLSTITAAYTASSGSNSGSGSGSGSNNGGTSTTTYDITVLSAQNGNVSASASKAKKGATVTVTASPETGYVLDTVTVKDKDGNTLTLTDKGSGKYTFTMPAKAVTVSATFKAETPDQPSQPGGDTHDCPASNFSDVNLSLWYHEAIDYALLNEIMNGTGDTTFAPDNALTRAMMAQILYNLAGRPAGGSESFTDVNEDDWFYAAVAWASENGIVKGLTEDTFGPTQPVTRQQMVTMLYRFCQYLGLDVSVGEDTNILSYADAEQIDEYAVAAFQWAVGAGVINGMGDNTLNPNGTATRAQVAQMMTNFHQNFMAK